MNERYLTSQFGSVTLHIREEGDEVTRYFVRRIMIISMLYHSYYLYFRLRCVS